MRFAILALFGALLLTVPALDVQAAQSTGLVGSSGRLSKVQPDRYAVRDPDDRAAEYEVDDAEEAEETEEVGEEEGEAEVDEAEEEAAGEVDEAGDDAYEANGEAEVDDANEAEVDEAAEAEVDDAMTPELMNHHGMHPRHAMAWRNHRSSMKHHGMKNHHRGHQWKRHFCRHMAKMGGHHSMRHGKHGKHGHHGKGVHPICRRKKHHRGVRVSVHVRA